jgi:hypothetical protein
MARRSAIVVIIGMLLITWLLVSSIHSVPPSSSGSGSSAGSGAAGGFGGFGSFGNFGGFGSGFGPGFGFPALNWNFSFFNLRFPNWTINFPSFNFKWPSIHWPSFNFGGGGGGGTGSGSGSGSGSGTGSGQSGQSHSSGPSGNARTTNTQQIVIPQNVITILLIVIVLIIVAGFAVMMKNGFPKAFSRKTPQQLELEREMVPQASSTVPDFLVREMNLGENESIAEFRGWGSNVGLIRPRIAEDLPLIWSFEESLTMDVPEGSAIRFGREGINIQSEGGRVEVFLQDISNVVKCSFEDQNDEKWIRAVKYEEDVVKLFRLNLVKSREIDFKAMTPRELMNEVKKVEGVAKDSDKLYDMTKIFERAFYGQKQISRGEYEAFLRDLSGALASPKVIICGPKTPTQESGT